MNLAKTIGAVVLMTLGLSACDSMKIWRKAKPEPCPRVTVLKNASELTRFKEGPGRDLIDVLFEAKFSDVLSLCSYDVDYDTRAGLIEVKVAPVIAAMRGPADQNRFADVEYFVAIVNQERKILQKNTFNLRLGFPGNLTQNEVRDEPVDLEIVTDGSKDGADYEIYLGFQMTREEMAYQKSLSER